MLPNAVRQFEMKASKKITGMAAKEETTVERKIYQAMKHWEETSVQEPLMLIGVRQSGKTWIIHHFCKETYSDVFYLNLEEQPSFQSAFEGDLSPRVILQNLGILAGRTITAETAIVFDEIQVCERAITALKYFCEAPENYRVIAAGSLLGVKLRRFQSSFPVGKVHILHMYPMDFEEFLLACGEGMLRDRIMESYQTLSPLPSAIHEKAHRLCLDYMMVGGMPKAVEHYLTQGKDISAFSPEIHRNLHLAYLADMTKYVKNPYEAEKISQVYQSIPRQLAKENPKFQYNAVRPTGNKRDYESPIDWLKSSGMLLAVNGLEAPLSPLKSQEKDNMYKLYLSDVGMLATMCGMKARDLLPEQPNLYKGAIVENYLIQQFAGYREEQYYFRPSDSMEIDLVDDRNEGIIPIEIKSGRHKRSRSLHNYIDQFHPPFAIRFSALNFGKTDCLVSLPLYAAFCAC